MFSKQDTIYVQILKLKLMFKGKILSQRCMHKVGQNVSNK